MTVLEVLSSTTGYFQKRHIDSPRLNAEHLLAHVLFAELERTLPGVDLYRRLRHPRLQRLGERRGRLEQACRSLVGRA